MQFQMIFNDKGVYFPTDNKKVMVNKVELYRDGTMYDVRVVAAD
jgi:hypothetical protein